MISNKLQQDPGRLNSILSRVPDLVAHLQANCRRYAGEVCRGASGKLVCRCNGEGSIITLATDMHSSISAVVLHSILEQRIKVQAYMLSGCIAPLMPPTAISGTLWRLTGHYQSLVVFMQCCAAARHCWVSGMVMCVSSGAISNNASPNLGTQSVQERLAIMFATVSCIKDRVWTNLTSAAVAMQLHCYT